MMTPTLPIMIPSSDVTNDVLRTLESEIRIAQKQLNSKLADILIIRRNKYMNIVFYVVLLGTLALSSYIILSDLWRVFNIHRINSEYIKSNNETEENTLLTSTGDDYEYTSPYSVQQSINKSVINSLNNSSKNIESSLERAKDFRNYHSRDDTYYTNIDRNTLANVTDDYTYDVSKNGSSFWNELKQKPELISLLNNTPRRLYPKL